MNIKDLKRMLDDSEQGIVDDEQLKADTHSKRQSEAMTGRFIGREGKPNKMKGISFHTEETIEKIREKRKTQITSDETRIKMSTSRLGKKRGPMSDEIKEKISKSNKGKPGCTHTPEHLEKMRLLMTGNKFNKEKTPEQRRNLSIKGTKYIYSTPKGIFNTRKELWDAFPELTRFQLENRCKCEREGFSRKLKDDQS